eukprot:c20769_g1_i3 orf=208-945(+)
MEAATSNNTYETVKELNDPEDFEVIADHQGFISIGGFGSLLSEKSARYTFPKLRNFRVAKLSGFRRVFGHVAPVFFEREIANAETKETSSVSVEPAPEESIIITVFEISIAEVPAFIEREHEFRYLAVTPESLDGTPFPHPAVICGHFSDEEYHRVRCKGREEEFYQHYGKHNIETIWRDDIFPCRVYLRHCVLASKNLGSEAYNSFLDHTYLGDRRTTIRQYLASNPQIMEEEPLPSLKERYGG